MKNLTTAIFGKYAGSTLATLTGGRFFYGQAPIGTRFPYVVFFRVSGSQDWTFTENFDDVTIQFSVYSATPNSASEAHDIADAVVSLYSDCKLTVTSETFIFMWLSNTMGPMGDDSISQDGAEGGWACHLDFDVKTQT